MRNSSTSELTPDEVMAAVSGERAAVTRVARHYLPRVRNLVRYLIRDDRDVDDVSQEALIAVIRGLPSYRGDGKFKSWVDRIVARQTFGWLKRRNSREEPIRQLAVVEEAPEEPSSAPPLRLPTDFMARRQVAEALDQLPFEQRHALVLHHVLEMTVPEISDEMSAPAETVRSRLRLGRRRMRDLLLQASVEEPTEAGAVGAYL